jgi:predicted amidohydrolase
MKKSSMNRRKIFFVVLIFLTTSDLHALEGDVTISVYQGACIDGDFTANLATFRQVVQEALKRESNFLVFPETFLSGYDSPELMRKGARRMADPVLQDFISESSSHSMVILVGLARITDDGIYNSVAVIHRGEVIGTYDKIMLTGGDRDSLRFLPGSDVPVFTAHGARFSVIICHDS